MFYTQKQEFQYVDALLYFKKFSQDKQKFLFESRNVSAQGRLSLIGIEPTLELRGLQNDCTVILTHERGRPFFDFIATQFSQFVVDSKDTTLELHIPKVPFHGDEQDRFGRQNIAQIIRQMLLNFQMGEKNFMGLYGALSYNFIYLFENIPQSKASDSQDFHLFLFDTVFFFNHLTTECKLYCTRKSLTQATADIKALEHQLFISSPTVSAPPEIYNLQITPDGDTFKNQVAYARELCEKGELMELVLCRKITADIEGDPLHIYENYRSINPAPYLFYYDFGDEILLGASPEVMIRYENGKVILRPISGSAPRGKTTIDDHHLMMGLLNDPKEKSELDMLIDLGRNDLAKVCQPNINIDHYRVVEKYSHVMHTVAQLSGKLQEGHIGFDALIACLNAGTLTGAPKPAAMRYIEEVEEHPRGYYGGAVGYFLFNGDVNTGIVIRSTTIEDKKMRYLSGATLLYESVPEKELKETNFKAAAFIKSIEKFVKEDVSDLVPY